MSKIQTQYNKIVAQLVKLETFVALCGDQLEELTGANLALDGCYSLLEKQAGFIVSLSWAPEARRDLYLTLLGQVFGTDGWTAHSNDKHIPVDDDIPL